ncbi:FmdB family zinc ribbon protein [Modestobacter sp. NPDC049651]|uniref:FmdB family zinc ribbon protein n=1 Tax=unclassified Modestobacter TaxID=2643866 RepID=UPI0033F2B858
MAGYEYRCTGCGPWEVRLPIGTAEPTLPCPACGRPGRRAYTPPLLGRTPPAAAAARQRMEASADAPQVTSSVPAAARRPARRDPRWDSLPRP